MEDLGEIGFWLAVGIVVAALILAGSQKERETERQKQETLRALLTTDGKSTSEVLQYMRERDAAQQKREHDIWIASGGNFTGRMAAAVVAKLVGLFAFIAGIPFGVGAWQETGSWIVGVSLALGIWAGGAFLGAVIYLLFRGKTKNVPPPGA
jgi:hypothetical protein